MKKVYIKFYCGFLYYYIIIIVKHILQNNVFPYNHHQNKSFNFDLIKIILKQSRILFGKEKRRIKEKIK